VRFAIPPVGDPPINRRIATNGSRVLLAYQFEAKLYGILLDRDLRVVREAFPITSQNETASQSFDLASAGGTFLAAWFAGAWPKEFASAAAIDAEGNVQSAGVVFGKPNGGVVLGSNGTDYLLAAGSWAMRLSRLGFAAGDAVDVEPCCRAGLYKVTAVTWNGRDYVVGLSDPTGREGLCGDAAIAQVVGGERQILSDASGGSEVRLAPRGDGYFAAWSVGCGSGLHYLAGRTVRSTPGELQPLSIGGGGLPHADPAIASDRTDALVISVSGRLRLSRVGTLGVDRTEDLGAGAHPSIAFVGSAI